MNVVIYARYSTDKQTEQSIEGQLKICTEYAERCGYTVIGQYIDRALSGQNGDRPNFKRMLSDCKNKSFQGILVYKLDRFARNRIDSAMCRKYLDPLGVKILSATEGISDDPNGMLLTGVLETIAEYYSLELAEKVKRGMNINAEKCLSNGGTIPFGYKSIDKHLVVDEDTAPYVVKIFEMYANGFRTIDIAEYLNSRNLKTAHGAAFNKNSLHSILKNKKYIGVYKYGDIEIPDGVPRIISDDLFNRVSEVLAKNKKHAGHTKAKVEYLLTTKLFCGDCKAPMVGVSARSKTGKVYYYYSCNNARRNKVCSKKNIPKEPLENLVFKKCRELLTDKNIDKIATEVSAIAKRSEDNTELKRLKREHRETENAIDNLMKALEAGQNADIICERISQRRVQLSEIEKDISIQKMLHTSISKDDIIAFLIQLKNGKFNDIEYRKTLINVFVNSVYLYDDRITIIFNAGDIPVTVDNVLLEEISENSRDSPFLYSKPCGAPTFSR